MNNEQWKVYQFFIVLIFRICRVNEMTNLQTKQVKLSNLHQPLFSILDNQGAKRPSFFSTYTQSFSIFSFKNNRKELFWLKEFNLCDRYCSFYNSNLLFTASLEASLRNTKILRLFIWLLFALLTGKQSISGGKYGRHD